MDGNVKRNNDIKNKKQKAYKQNKIISERVLSVWRIILRLFSDVCIYFIAIIMAVYLCRYSYNFCYQVFGSAAVSKEGDGFTTSFTINSGITTMDVAEKLESKGLILDKNSFYIKAKLEGATIRPGNFVLSSEMDYDEILDIITTSNETETGSDN